MIYRDALALVFPSNIPITPGHVLLCPVQHAATVDDLSEEEQRALLRLIVRMKSAIKKSLGAEGFNVAWNEGSAAGQSVDHLHVHLVPRRIGDHGIYKYEPREFLYRPGVRGESPEVELREVAALIRSSLD